MKYLLTLSAAVLLLSSCVKDRDITIQTVSPGANKTLIHYWNFNGSSFTVPSYTVGGGTLSFNFTTVSGVTGYADLLSPVVPNTNINARNGDTAGNALRVRNPVTDFTVTGPTTGYKNIIVSYSVAKSGSGASTNTVSYTTDGTTYVNAGLSTISYSPGTDPDYILESFDLSGIGAVNNNPNFKFRIVFADGNLGTSGNDRFDNVTVDGDPIGGPSAGNIPVISGGSIASGTVGAAFSPYTITASNSPISFAVTNLPPGLSLNSTTGIISGTPTVAGTYIDTLKATNASGTGTKLLTITITAAPVLTLLHYWNFNNTTSLATLITPAVTIGGGALSFSFTGAGYYDSVASTTSLNAQNGAAMGFALRVRNPSVSFTITAPTTGYHDVILKYAVEASSTASAALGNTVSYSTDGTNFTSAGIATPTYDLTSFIDPNYTLKTFDFTSIPAANNNPNFKIRITFSNGNTNTSGNDRFDNISLQGYP